MSTFTMPSGQGNHLRDRRFKRSILISFGLHAVIIAAAGSMTLFKMSGTNYAPSYTVDLVAIPSPKPAPAPKAVPVVKPVPKKVEKKPEPRKEKPAAKPAAVPPPADITKELQSSKGDEAARLERRKKIEELEMEARRLYESFTSEEAAPAQESAESEDAASGDVPVTETQAGGSDAAADIRFRAYYDRIWIQIRSAWVVPEGVTANVRLVTVVSIRIASSGEIEQFWIEERSGNEYYDQSALRAIRRANPLPPLPDGIDDDSLEVGINFRYPE